MQPLSVTEELDALPKDHRFDFMSSEVVERLAKDSRGLDNAREILLFMETYPKIDYGVPGALVHYMEEFYRKGYEPLLVDSIRRKPTAHTLSLLRRLINGARDPEERQQYLNELCNARNNPLIDKEALDRVNYYVDALGVECR